jgi:PKHD-type hydroxylase
VPSERSGRGFARKAAPWAPDVMLLHLPQVLTESQLAHIRATLNHKEARWVDGRVTAGHQGAAVKRNRQLEESSTSAQELGALILATLGRNALFISAVLPNRLYPPMFNHYVEGMEFGTHVDGSIRTLGPTRKMRTDLSATLFLSPKDSYDGGELIIENDFGSQTVKLDAGDMIVYDATARHRVAPCTRGERLASVFWIQSLVRGDAERTQLFELDRTIQKLTELGAEPDCLVRLAAHYHSLLRLWADT